MGKTVEDVICSISEEQIKDITALIQAPHDMQESIMEQMPRDTLKALVALLEAEAERRGLKYE